MLAILGTIGAMFDSPMDDLDPVTEADIELGNLERESEREWLTDSEKEFLSGFGVLGSVSHG